MGIDHSRAHIPVAQEFLHCADVVSIFKDMSSKGVSQRVGCRRLGDARPADGLFDGPLEHGFVEVVSPPLASLAIHVDAGCRKHASRLGGTGWGGRPIAHPVVHV